MVFIIQKKRKCLNYRYFRIGDQMVDGFLKKSGFFRLFWVMRTKTVGFPVG